MILIEIFTHFHLDCNSNNSESGPNSPPTLGSRGSPTSAPIQEENEDPHYNGVNRANINDLQLFSSPSMPNISLGRPHLSNVAAVAAANQFVSELSLRKLKLFFTFFFIFYIVIL